MIRKLYDWTLSFAQTKYALWILILVAFAESSFFPIPPEVLLIPMIIALPSRAFTYAALCTLASVAGGLLGYYIGAALFQSVALVTAEEITLWIHTEKITQGLLDHLQVHIII